MMRLSNAVSDRNDPDSVLAGAEILDGRLMVVLTPDAFGLASVTVKGTGIGDHSASSASNFEIAPFSPCHLVTSLPQSAGRMTPSKCRPLMGVAPARQG